MEISKKEREINEKEGVPRAFERFAPIFYKVKTNVKSGGGRMLR